MSTNTKFLLLIITFVLFLAFSITLSQFIAQARHLHAEGKFKVPQRHLDPR